MDITKKIYWLIQAGVTSFCGEQPAILNTPRPVSKDQPASAQAEAYAVQAKTLDVLNAEKKNFTLSSLKKTATHTLLGFGPNNPKLMCILDIPDTESDRSGTPLSGANGEMFKKMMIAIGLDWQKDVYATYFSPWRTPGNRPLTTAEQNMFAPFLKREIQLVQPQKMLFFGSSIARALLGCESLAKARGSWHNFDGIPTRVTLALGDVNNTKSNRQHTWDDLQAITK
ncbi:MAG: uracil-DNA glycosylase [Alphaproteobacteria bacterium]|nr:uracil-DNA glycosylase [Alphaproteobacteria bacterium]